MSAEAEQFIRLGSLWQHWVGDLLASSQVWCIRCDSIGGEFVFGMEGTRDALVRALKSEGWKKLALPPKSFAVVCPECVLIFHETALS